MGLIRSYLYDRFENFDKPNEDEFRVFIDSALLPTTFNDYLVTVTSDIYTDINLLQFDLAIRECFVIYYGTKTYILYGIEGLYGSGGTEITSTNLTLIAGGENTISQSLTANTSIPEAGIKSGDSYPAGTDFETILRDLLIITKVSNLTYESNDADGFLEVGDTLSITKFLWAAAGTPTGLHLEDSDGQLSTNVTGTQVTVAEAYTYSSYKALTWTLSGSNVDSITTTAYWVEASYYGRNTTGVEPTEAQILAGTKVLVLTEDFIEVPIGTTNQEYGWIAVPSNQTTSLYTTWRVTVNSTANIGSSEFIKYSGNVTVAGETYFVYLFNWISEVSTLKLT